MKLSIIIPVYNTLRYLQRCLDSIFAQLTDECEAIIVDDGSTDGSSQTCDTYGLKYVNAQVIHQSNAGVSAARNRGIDFSQGRYLWFCDSDDRLLPGAIEKLLEVIDDKDPEIINFPAVVEDGEEKRLGLIPAAMSSDYCHDGPLRCGDPLYPYAHVIRRDLVGDVRFDERLTLMEDRDFLYRVCVKVRKEVSILDEPLYAYLVTREGSAVNSSSVANNIGADDVQYGIFENEASLGRPEPAYSTFASHALGAIALIAKTGGCKDSFEALRQRLLRHDEFSRDLHGTMALKYAVCKRMPHLFYAIYRMVGLLPIRHMAGSTVLDSTELRTVTRQ